MSGTVSARWFFSDWLSDPGLRASSLAARGLWKDLLCFAASNKDGDHGFVLINGKAPTPTVIAKLVQSTPQEVSRLLAELAENGVFSRDKRGVIYCRRMTRAQKNRENGRLGGNPNLLKENKKQKPVIHPPDMDMVKATDIGSSKESKKKKRMTMPQDWRPDERGVLWAKTVCHFADLKIEKLIVACRDYHLKHGTLIADFPATWRMWCNNDIKFTMERKNGQGRYRPLSEASASRAAQNLADAARRGDFSFGQRPRLQSDESEDDLRLLPKGRCN